MHGPASTSGGSFKAPIWPHLPRISVLDTVALTLSPSRGKTWRRQRDATLHRWANSGLRFPVVEDDPDSYPKLDPDTMGSAEGLCSVMVEGKLRLMSAPTKLGDEVEAFGDWRCGGGLAAFKLGSAFWMQNDWNRAYLMTHEVGHALGLNHQPEGRSVMNGYARVGVAPDEHDIESLQTYYEVAA